MGSTCNAATCCRNFTAGVAATPSIKCNYTQYLVDFENVESYGLVDNSEVGASPNPISFIVGAPVC